MTIRSGSVSISIEAVQTALVGIATLSYNPRIQVTQPFENGTDADTKADLVGSRRETLTGGADSVDLAGGDFVDGTNAPITPIEVVAIAIKAADDNEDDVVLDTSGTNGWAAGVDGTITLSPGGVFVLYAPPGLAVTAGTADLIGATGTAGDVVDFFLLGRSA